MFVPTRLFATPQRFAVFVNAWSLMRTNTGSRPACMAAGITASSSRTVPFLHLADLERHARAALQHAAQFAEHAPPSRPASRRRAAGRDVDVVGIDAAEPAAQPVVDLVVDDRQERRRGDDEVDRRLGEFRRVVRPPSSAAAPAPPPAPGARASAGSRSFSSARDFFSTIARTSRRGGTCPRAALIFRWFGTEVAWFGGSV